MMGKGLEATGEKDFDEISKPPGAADSKSKSLEVVEEFSAKTPPDVPTKRLTRRHSGKEVAEESVVPSKKMKIVVKSGGGEVLKPHQPSFELESPAMGEMPSVVKTAAAADGYLDQVCLFFFVVVG